jgi:hypothetical protein
MKKVKIDQDKVIKIKPRMVKEGVDGGSFLFILIFAALVIFMLTSCGEAPQSQYKKPAPQNNELSKDAEYYNLKVDEYTYEGCEYIRIDAGSAVWGSHKGNCKNPIHKENGSN